jgi:hypothetical protein
MKFRTASLCVLASPFLLLAHGSLLRGQSFEGPVFVGGPSFGGGVGDG